MCYVSGVYHYLLYCEFASEQHWKCDLVSIIFFSRIFLLYFSLVLCVSWRLLNVFYDVTLWSMHFGHWPCYDQMVLACFSLVS